LNPADSPDDVIALYPRRSLWNRVIWNRWIQIAALVIVMVSVSFAVWNAIEGGRPFELLASGDKEKLILNDGTLVWLNRGSAFTYYETEDGTRHATLSGEGLFEVAKIPGSLFTIACGSISVKVLGTSFSLKTGEDSIELKVLTGKVNLSSKEDADGINVLPDEKVVYRSSGRAERTPLADEEASAIIAETEYAMRFDNNTIDEVVEKIEKKFDVGVTVKDSRLLKCRVTVDLTDNSLDKTLSMLTDLLDMSFEIDDNQVVLFGKGCD
jgi:ferric-dicitrate binding protein FerR (iron transport regulator)